MQLYLSGEAGGRSAMLINPRLHLRKGGLYGGGLVRRLTGR